MGRHVFATSAAERHAIIDAYRQYRGHR